LNALLRLDVVATHHVLARITSIIAKRGFEVVTMEISEPADGRRQITIEVAVADEHALRRLVAFFNQSPDVVTVVHPSRDAIQAAPGE